MDQVSDFVERSVAPHADTFDRREQIDSETLSAIRSSGLLAATVPNQHGGRGIDLLTYGRMHRQIGMSCSSVRSLFTVHDMVAEALHRVGGPARTHWLDSLVDGSVLAAFALTEPASGSDASSISTVAHDDGDVYRINGEKTWISFGEVADILLVVARLGQSGPIGAFIVPTDLPGVTKVPIRGLLGLRASMLASIRFDDCEIPAEFRIGPASIPSNLITSVALNLGRYSVAWGCLGITDACLELSYARAEDRHQFGGPIVDHQLIRRRLTDMATEARASELMCRDAAEMLETKNLRAIEATLMAKYHASEVAFRVADHAVQIHGAVGVHETSPVERHFRDARVMRLIEGSTEVQQITIPKHVMKRFKRSRQSSGNDA
jgi:alkylation response protein AidB-like acyl-CoA dehydrogenase